MTYQIGMTDYTGMGLLNCFIVPSSNTTQVIGSSFSNNDNNNNIVTLIFFWEPTVYQTLYSLHILLVFTPGFLNLGTIEFTGPEDSFLWGVILRILGLATFLASIPRCQLHTHHLQLWQPKLSADITKYLLVGEITPSWELLRIVFQQWGNCGSRQFK